MFEVLRRGVALVAGVVAVFVLTSCTEGAVEGGVPSAAEEEPIELVDPWSLAPEDLCEVPSGQTLEEVMGPAEHRTVLSTNSGPQEITGYGLRLECRMAQEPTAHRDPELWFDAMMEVTEAPRDRTSHPKAENAASEVDLGDYVVIEPHEGDNGADVFVVEGQVFIQVVFKQKSGRSVGDAEEFAERGLRIAEELLASVG